MKRYFFILFLILSFNLSASDVSVCSMIGFSGDAKYFAFERFGVHEGSAYSEIMIIDVCKNEYVLRPITTIEKSGTESIAREKNKLKAASDLAKYGIVEGNTGDRIFKCSSNCSGNVKFKVDEETMELFLQQLEDSENCGASKQKRLVLSLKTAVQSTVLQKDEKVPKTRKCASDYKIEEVRILDNFLVVVISVQVPAIEGKDTRQIVVTGCLPKRYK